MKNNLTQRDATAVIASEEQKLPIDFLLLFILIAIVSLGLVALYSASAFNDKFHEFQKQVLAIVLGSFGLVLVMELPNHAVRWLARYGVWICILILPLVFVPYIGAYANGSWRWIKIGALTFQPAELAKVAFILYVAELVQRKPDVFQQDLISQWPSLLILLVIGALLAFQPDNGTIMVIVLVVVSMMITSGMRAKVWAPIFMLGLAAGLLLLFLHPYVQLRTVAFIKTFINPFEDTEGSNWQVINSLIAIGRGGFMGVGLGESVQKMLYLPHVSNDFITAMIAEELGYWGILMLLSLFATLILRLMMLAERAGHRGDLFGAMLTYGIAYLISIQSLVHLGVNTGWFPNKGLTLPFISYGSSSIMVLIISMGFVFNIQRQKRMITYT
jgi:cell division protein FtsW